MKSQGSAKFILAVVFAAALILSTGAEASGLFALGGDSVAKTAAERQIGLFEHALDWLTGAWTNLTAAFVEDNTTPPPGCTNPDGCDDGDSGWTIDPEG
jgi:hypothetical protein